MQWTTVYFGRVIGLYREDEVALSGVREQWYCGLPPEDRAAVDSLCLAAAGSALHPHLSASFSASLHAQLARLAVEYAAVVRRAVRDRKRSLTSDDRGQHSIADLIYRGFRYEDEAKPLLTERWFREMTAEQAGAFDSTRSARVKPSPAETTEKPRRRARMPSIPQMYKKPMKFLSEFQAHQKRPARGGPWRDSVPGSGPRSTP